MWSIRKEGRTVKAVYVPVVLGHARPNRMALC